MQRRGFLRMMGAAGLAPLVPSLPAAAPAVTAGYSRYMYGLAVFQARTRATITAADLVSKLRINHRVAQAMMAEMSAQGMIAPVANSTAMRAVTKITGGPAKHVAQRPAPYRPRRDRMESKARVSRPKDIQKAPELQGRRSKMEKFETITGVAAPMPLVNIDTDMIIPKVFLKSIQRTGFGKNLFDEMRYNRDGTEIEDFVLNKPQYRNAEILIAGDNFGCGSSREHAPWAIADFGIRCVVSTSFADIFYNNCFKNGILPIKLPQDAVDVLMKDAEKGANARMIVNLEEQTVTTSDGEVFSFDVDAFKKHCLLEGLDDIGLSMEKSASIDAFEQTAAQARPWV